MFRWCPLIKDTCRGNECAWYVTTDEGAVHDVCEGCAFLTIACEIN